MLSVRWSGLLLLLGVALAGAVPRGRAFDFASVWEQAGASMPTSWGIRDGWNVPAWYRVTPPPDAPARESLERALQALPVLGLEMRVDDLFGAATGIYTHPMESGDAWERSGRLVWMPSPGNSNAPVPVGVRIQGGWNRRPEESPKHSFRLVFRARHGAPKWNVALFGGAPEGFDQLILRAGNNHSWLHWSAAERRRADYLRDAWMRASHAAMGHPAARSRPVHLFLNGLYWGVYELCERPDGKFAADAWGGREKDYDARNADKTLSGDDASWKQMFGLANRGIRDAEDYRRLGEHLDVPAFIDYMLLNLYGANADWDAGSNWYAARRRAPGGRWRFFVWDGERTLEGVEDWRIDDDSDLAPTRLFQRLRAWEGFRSDFAARARRHLAPGGVLGAEASRARYEALAGRLEPAIVGESARWGDYRRTVHPYKEGPYEFYGRRDHWKPEVDRLVREYFPRRTGVVIERLKASGLW